MNKQNVLYPYNGILFSLKKEKSSDTFYDMHEFEDFMLRYRKANSI